MAVGLVNPADKVRRGVSEVLPGKLYQRAHFLTWPYMDKHDMLDQLGVNVVINLWRPVDSDLADHHRAHSRAPRTTRPTIYLNWHMDTNRPPEDAVALVGFGAYLLRRNHVLLVHCEAGRNRSAWLCARLVKEVMTIGGEAALAIVREKIPNSAINQNLVEDILSADYIGR